MALMLLDKESPIQAVCGKAARTDLGGGRAVKRASLPLRGDAITLRLRRQRLLTLRVRVAPSAGPSFCSPGRNISLT